MPTTPKPKIDLKATDEHHRRLWCPDRHRIVWDDAGQIPMTGPGAGRDYISGGLCSAGDTWQMQRLRPGYDGRKQGAGITWRLEKMGKAGWDRPGSFKVRREDWYATVAHEVGGKTVVDFNCSHGHFTMPSRLSRGEEAAHAEHLGSCPREIRFLAEAAAQTVPMAGLMRDAIHDLTEQGWDFVTDDRIRCPRCIAEEAELDAKLAELRALDSKLRESETPPAADATAARASMPSTESDLAAQASPVVEGSTESGRADVAREASAEGSD